ncbi:cupin domain-containing protein [Zeaxanthinibacter enoshimensis]|uniref:Quercetin dioxygenase-like cupin family protein n=1 Tax=Zeaxanthinibacter enoshimensis TaxID=392009 RepID=A0A4R6TNK5_9FLAO|nr:cupin domain-containing protein [Zeaxanthinibacter enoshimensis]TDQ30921.1 quercetin dioxygenase-like cupin family protein [Zeaxanthinibacter enoshimensis]
MKTIKNIGSHIALCALLLFANSSIAQGNTATNVEKSHTTTADDKTLNWMPAPDFFPGCTFTILHGDPAKPNLDFFFKIEPNTEVINHTHNSPERMILISGELEVQYEGEDPVVLTEGSYAYGPAGKPHRAKCLDNGPCVLFVAMVDPFDAVPVSKEE